MNLAAARELAELSAKLRTLKAQNNIYKYFPEVDMPRFASRDRYPKQMELYRRGADVFARLFMAANGVGKTEAALFEICCHLRGWYPDWWVGRRFNRSVDIWVCGKTSETVMDIQQQKMLGKPYEEGTGMMPAEWIDYDSISRSGVPGAISAFRVKREDGGYSYCGFKSYKQGVEQFFGPEKDAIHLDEPPPVAIYAECVARTRNREGAFVLVTASPKEGQTETIKLFMEEDHPSRLIVNCSWADVPHLTEEWKANTRANTPAYLLEATELGIPGRGAGAVYPVTESTFVIDPFKLPSHFRWIWGLDGGYHNTAAGWFAYDPDADVAYLVSDYKDGGEGTDLSVHAARFIARNKALKFPDMPGVGDIAAISQVDGKKLLTEYKKYGLNVRLAKKAVHTGIDVVLERMQTGRFKVFSTCDKWLAEFRTYSYKQLKDGEAGQVVKINDHLMDVTRYACMDVQAVAASPRSQLNNFKELQFG